MRVKVWSAAACVAALAVAQAPVGVAVAQRSAPAPLAADSGQYARLRARGLSLLHDRAAPAGPRRGFAVSALRPAGTTPVQAAAVGAPQQLRVGGAIGRAYLTWQPPADTGGEPVTGYRVYRGRSAATLAAVGVSTGTATLHRRLTVGVTYYYAVAALTASGEGERTAAVRVWIPRRELVLAVPSATGTALVAQARRGELLVPILDDGHDNHSPAVSPDGRWLAYVSNINGHYGVYARRADGSSPVTTIAVRTEHNHNEFFEPTWSADSQWVGVAASDGHMLFRRRDGRDGFTTSVDSFSPSFTPGRSVVQIAAATGALHENLLPGDRSVKSDAMALDADVSPDGKWVAYARLEQGVGETPLTTIRLVSRYGGPSRLLAAPGGLNLDIAWSRTGSRIYFTHADVDPAGAVGAASVKSIAPDGSGYTTAGPGDRESWTPAHRAVGAPPRAVAPRTPTFLPDFDGDGDHDLGVFRPSTGMWIVPGRFTLPYGRAGDIPVPGDFNGNGRSEVAVYRPSTGTWHVRGKSPVRWGRPGDVPVPSDYNGDGRDEFAVWRPSNGRWYVRGRASVQFGRRGDVPMPGEWAGNPGADLVVWRPSNGTWYFRQPPLGDTRRAFKFGQAGDVPVRSEWAERSPSPNLGIFRPSTGDYYEWLLAGSRGRELEWRFNGPAEAFGSVPLGIVDGPNWGDYTIFQPATGIWSGHPTPNWPQVLGRTGDLPL